jgi:hypothetical protein
MLILSVAGVASAIPYNWSETIDWDSDEQLNPGNFRFGYSHDLGNDGFNLGVVESYQLTIRLYDAENQDIAFFLQREIPVPEMWGGNPHIHTQGEILFHTSRFGGRLLENIVYDDGTLYLAIEHRYGGAFCIDWSRIEASGIRGDHTDNAPVPEPATMLLLGTGLAGMAAAGRRKKKK